MAINTLQERVSVVDFLYSIYNDLHGYWIKDTLKYTTESLFRAKEFLNAISEVFIMAQNGNIDSDSADIDYHDLLAKNFNDIIQDYMYGNYTTEYIDSFKKKLIKLISEEYEYEDTHKVNAIFNIFRNAYYMPKERINGSDYSLQAIDVTISNISQTSFNTFKVKYTKGSEEYNRELVIDCLNREIVNYKCEDDAETKWILRSVIMAHSAIKSLENIYISVINERLIHIRDQIAMFIGKELESGPEYQIRFNPTNHIGKYSHRLVSMPIVGNLLGVELEFSGNVSEIFKFKQSFSNLRDQGYVLEKDASVDFELKSPIVSLDEIKRVFSENNKLFWAWGNITDPNHAGLHFHISMDDSLAVNKYTTNDTFMFLVRVAQSLESHIFNNRHVRKIIFKRDYQRYCLGYGNNNDIDRYRWINFLNLNRDSGKTIEIRLFSASAASELDKAAEKALLIAKLFKYSLRDWMAKDKLEYTEWVKSFGDTKIFKALFSREEVASWLELFSKPIQSAKVA